MRFTFRDSETGLFKAVLDPRFTPTHLNSVHPEPAPISADTTRDSDSDQNVRLQYLDAAPGVPPLTPAS